MSLGRSAKMTKMKAMHSREIGLARHPVGVRRNGHEWVGVRSTPDRCSDFLQPGGTLVAILWGRRGGRSDWVWSARGRIERHRGCTGPAPVTLLTPRNPCGDDGVDPTRAPSCRNDGAQTIRLAQSVRRSPISDKAADNWHRRHHLRRQLTSGASIRLAPCARTDGSDCTVLLGRPSPGRVAKGCLR
jgi:hypothetical protein